MTNSDMAIGVVGLPNVGAQLKKPTYLVTLTGGKKETLFLSLDKPEILDGFIQVKGAYVDDASQEVSKEDIIEMIFPNHKIVSIKNLVFKAK